MNSMHRKLWFALLVLTFASCSSPPVAANVSTPTDTPTPTLVATATEELINLQLIDAYEAAYSDPHAVLSRTEPGADFYASYLTSQITDGPLPIPGNSDLALSPQAARTIAQNIEEYSLSVENLIGKKPSNTLKVSWNQKEGDQFAFAIYGTEDVNGQLVMFWAADVAKAGTLENPLLSFNPFPPNFGISSPRSTQLIQIPLPPYAIASNLQVRWWQEAADPSLQSIPAVVITVSKLEFHLFDVTKSQQTGIGNGWSSVLRPKTQGMPDLGNNSWQMLALNQGLTWAIAVISADGSVIWIPPVRNLQLGVSHPIWSPDGKRIAFLASWYANNYKYEIFVTNADGTNPMQLTHMRPESMGNPAWSPDGKRIAFTAGYDTEPPYTSQLYVMNANGSAVTQLTELPEGEEAYIGPVSWTAESQGIVYTLSEQRWLITLDGSVPTQTQLPEIPLPQGCFGPNLSLMAKE